MKKLFFFLKQIAFYKYIIDFKMVEVISSWYKEHKQTKLNRNNDSHIQSLLKDSNGFYNPGKLKDYDDYVCKFNTFKDWVIMYVCYLLLPIIVF